MTLHADVVVTRDLFELRVALEASPRELLAVVGPNGAGKSTLLRALAGLERLHAGTIFFRDTVWDDARSTFVPPWDRGVGFVPQSDALLPHLDARANIAFALRRRGLTRHDAARDAMRWLDELGVAQQASVRPRRLSGGQAKRVALARAFAIEPELLLLDEPFAGLDTVTRSAIRSHLASRDCTRVLVTHEPIDALALADRVIVLEGGRVVQTGLPDDLRSRPRSRYVADLVGVNLYRGTLTPSGLHVGPDADIVAADLPVIAGEALATVHPRAVAIYTDRPDGSPRNVWQGTITSIDREGDIARVRIEGTIVIVAEVTRGAMTQLGLRIGVGVFATVKASEVSVYPV